MNWKIECELCQAAQALFVASCCRLATPACWVQAEKRTGSRSNNHALATEAQAIERIQKSLQPSLPQPVAERNATSAQWAVNGNVLEFA
jgi:hypothetical protein